jgi:transposase
LTTKGYLVCDRRGALAFVLTAGQVADTVMLRETLAAIRVPGPAGRPRGRPERVIADKGYPSKANRAWLREHGIRATIPEWDDQIAHRRREPGRRPIDFGRRQQERYRGRNVVELSSSKLKQWRGTAVRSDRTARNYHAALCLASILHWLNTSFSNTAQSFREYSCHALIEARLLAGDWLANEGDGHKDFPGRNVVARVPAVCRSAEERLERRFEPVQEVLREVIVGRVTGV